MAQLTWFGHSCFYLESGTHSLLIDPFIKGNPVAPPGASKVQPTFILVTHGHGDHFGDTLEIARATGATVIAPNELAVYAGKHGCNNHPMHIGGAHDFPFGRVKLTIAHHGSGLETPDGIQYLGDPCGFLITLEGKTLYHAGDTALFLDMKLIGELNAIDVALLPIGDNFTMGPEDAVKAVEFLQPKIVIPMHYNTFPIIRQNVSAFSLAVTTATVNVLDIGTPWKF